jgi:hypothetical protein
METDDDTPVNRRSFMGKVAWVATGGVLAASAALAQAESVAVAAGPTGDALPGTGGDGVQLGVVSAAIVAAGAGALWVAQRRNEVEGQTPI